MSKFSLKTKSAASRGRTQPAGWLAFLCLMAMVAGVHAQNFSASFNQEFLQVGQPAVLSLSFEGVAPSDPPAVPNIPGAQAYYNGQQQQWTSINGVAKVKKSFNYLVMPGKAGELVVPAVSVNIGGQQLTTESIRIKVVTPDQVADAESDMLSKLAFVQVKLPKNEAYVGEVIPAEVKVYATAAENLQLHQFKAEGFTLGKASQVGQSREVVDGRTYHVVTFHMPIAARKIGRLPVGPAECTLNVVVPTDPRNPTTDPFGRPDIFGRSNMRSVRITSDEEQLDVLPLPTENVPANFNGAVGQFQMKVSATPTELPAGDPITYTVQMQAHGTLDDLKLPEQAGWREFKTYPATSNVIQKDPLGTAGVVQFEQIVIPTHAEIKELPPFEFSFFDPDLRQYRMLKQAAIPLNVQPNSAPVAQPSYVGSNPLSVPEPEAERAEDIAHIEPRLGSPIAGSLVMIRQPWFYLLQMIPIAGWLSVLTWKKRKQRIANDPRLQRRLQVERLVASGLKELNLLAERKEAEPFFETTLRLLKEQLGERLDLPAVSITEEIIEERLRPMGVAADELDRMHALFQTCNHARYAGELSSSDLHESMTELEAVINSLKQLRSA